MAFFKKNETRAPDTPAADAGATASAINGAEVPAPQARPEPSEEEKRKLAAASKHLSAQFGEIVTVLMRSPLYKHSTLDDLRWLVIPALLNAQYALATAQSKESGLTAPVGLVLWARVSEDVDKRLQASIQQPIKLAPNEWRSGNLPWVIAAVGDDRILKSILGRLHAKEWNKVPGKIHTRTKNGKLMVVKIEAKDAAPAQGQGSAALT